ncbi:hypothetical protein JCM10213_008854 [Rhodosporidiobolus nylandii]
MLPHDGWGPSTQHSPQDDIYGVPAVPFDWEEAREQRAARALEIEGRIATQRLDQALPSFEAFGLAGDGATSVPEPLRGAVAGPPSALPPTQPQHGYRYIHTTTTVIENFLPPAAPPTQAPSFPPYLQSLPFPQSDPLAPPHLPLPAAYPAQPPHAPSARPISIQQHHPAWFEPAAAAPVEPSGSDPVVVGGLAQIPWTSGVDAQLQGQPLSAGPLPALPPPSYPYPSYPAAPQGVSNPYLPPALAVPGHQQAAPTMQDSFKPHWQQVPLPQQASAASAWGAREAGTSIPPMSHSYNSESRPRWPPALSTPQIPYPLYLPPSAEQQQHSSSMQHSYISQQRMPDNNNLPTAHAFSDMPSNLVQPHSLHQASFDPPAHLGPLPGPVSVPAHDPLAHPSVQPPSGPSLLQFPPQPLALPKPSPTENAPPPSVPAAPPVDFAASNRLLSQTASGKRTRLSPSSGETSSGIDGSTSAAPAPSAGKGGKKQTVDLFAHCIICRQLILRLILRGRAHEVAVPHTPVFTCSACVAAAAPAAPASPDLPGPDGQLPTAPSSSSAAEGTSATKAKTLPFRKKKRVDAASALTACDVCLRDVAVGGVLPAPVGNPPVGARIDFMIEVVCASCDSKYKRCTDCGGGGGARAGTGKWRSKELFHGNRKTCCLNHQRLGAFPDMEYDVHKVSDIPADELDDLSQRCGRIFVNQMLSGICIPEVFEQDGAIFKTYAEADARAHAGWAGLDPLMRYDVEAKTGIRRYLALRTCTPNLRKTTKQAKKEEDEKDERKKKPRKENPVILKDGKEIAGYILAEYEMNVGNVFLAIVTPWDPTGETFDATTLLLGALVRRVDADLKQMNAERANKGEPLLPPHLNTWTMLFFKKESRVLGSLVKKRELLFIDDFLAKYPETDRKQFPPHRPCYIPVERQAGWQILIRRQKHYPDGRFDDWNARRAVDEERGKKKEQKAKQARLEKDAEEERKKAARD